jgi:hypothetical protein
MFVTMRSFLWLLLLGGTTAGRSVSATVPLWMTMRRLEDAAAQDLSQATVHQGNCFRMKIVSDNDDDGNSYFYNGAYRAQYKRYISYYICDSNSGGSCREYVSDLEDYLEQTVGYVQSWCSSCASNCRRRLEDATAAVEGGRQLEENDAAVAEGVTSVDCKTCASDCKLLNTNKGNSGLDESGYLACQAGSYEGDIQYYTAPQCENGHVVIGHFYDNECTIKTNTLSDEDFSYNTFQTIENIKVDCSVSSSCLNLETYSISCDNNSANGQQDANVCKASAAAGRVYTYYTKPFYKEIPIALIVFLVCALTSLLGFLSYTYYVHHSRTRIPMATLDGAELPEIL